MFLLFHRPHSFYFSLPIPLLYIMHLMAGYHITCSFVTITNNYTPQVNSLAWATVSAVRMLPLCLSLLATNRLCNALLSAMEDESFDAFFDSLASTAYYITMTFVEVIQCWKMMTIEITNRTHFLTCCDRTFYDQQEWSEKYVDEHQMIVWSSKFLCQLLCKQCGAIFSFMLPTNLNRNQERFGEWDKYIRVHFGKLLGLLLECLTIGKGDWDFP